LKTGKNISTLHSFVLGDHSDQWLDRVGNVQTSCGSGSYILWCSPRAINRTTTPVKAWHDEVLEQPLPVKGITANHRASRTVVKVRTSVLPK
jgi:hypothetical protein